MGDEGMSLRYSFCISLIETGLSSCPLCIKFYRRVTVTDLRIRL